MQRPEQVILVDEADEPIGAIEKMAAHRDGGRLHRAFSILIFNGEGELLLQQRAMVKYHFGGLWTNTCCGHPRPGEPTDQAARRRLAEEFGFDTDLESITSFIYLASDDASGLTEHEYLYVFRGTFDGEPTPAPDEIDDYRWIPIPTLRAEVADMPERFTPWFRMIMEHLE